MNYGSEFQNKSSSLKQEEDEEVADELSDNSLISPKDGFPRLCEQGDNTFRSNNIMKYARGKHTQLNIG